MNTTTIILIPSYEPTTTFITYVEKLKEDFLHIVIVNDGSNQSYDPIFSQLQALDHVEVISYHPNLGKGHALKVGYQFIKDHFPTFEGIICVDSDGQHHRQDVLFLSKQIQNYPHSLLLGIRDFTSKNVPFKSRLGNHVTSLLFYILKGIQLADTQTGLRAFDHSLIDFMINIKGERFEYETQVLIDCIDQKIPIQTFPIKTIYTNNNKGTHYQVWRDSRAIGKILFAKIGKFITSSFLCTLVDLGLAFVLFDLLLKTNLNDLLRITLATFIARSISMILNYSLNKRIVFKKETSKINFIRYLSLALFILLASSFFVYLLKILGLNEKIAKPIVDSLLFIISYQIQNKWVFKGGQANERTY